jgi:UDP-galactopyranose mutase (EC 5.4.99.9)
MSSLSRESIAVVGAGFGGLSAAAHLGSTGANVTLYEKGDHVGGVAGRIVEDGFQFDTGPSWYLMPELFERFFEQFDHEAADFYELERLDPNYQVFWKDGDQAAVPADPEQAMELFESYEEGAGETLDRYLDDAKHSYEVGMEKVVIPDRTDITDYLDPSMAWSARGLGLDLIRTMDGHAEKYFDHPKLRQLVEYTLVFLGGSPYNTPALYSLMSHVDYNLGVYYPQGGIAAVVDGVRTVAEEQGATIHTNTPVTRIEPAASGLVVGTSDDRTVYDHVVVNAPPAHAEQELLPAGAVDRSPDHWDNQTYAPSAYMLYLGIEGELPELDHHTLVLPTDWEPYFESIFEDPAWPDNPSYYLNVPSRTDPTVAPDGHETVVVLVPLAPGLDDSPENRAAFREQIFDGVVEHTGVELRDRIVFERERSVSDFAQRFNKPRGSALGIAHTLRQTGPLRTKHRAPGVDNLYYVGSNTNPGIGVPMCLLSGEHVADTVREDITSSGTLSRLLS